MRLPMSPPPENASVQVIGIDLGMTSVVAAYVPEPGKPPVVIPIESENTSLPAIVTILSNTHLLIGHAAKEILTTHPRQTIFGLKRLLGRGAKSPAVLDLSSRVGYQIGEAPNGETFIYINHQKYRIPELAQLLLQAVRKAAESHLGEPVKHCVVAVPAYFNQAQKAAISEAARMAGLSVNKLVHEPTAVALAYGFNRQSDARVLIIDMGGVRLDVSVMEISGNVFDIVATGGDPYLGGSDIDALIANWLFSTIKYRYQLDLTQDPKLVQKVRETAEYTKKELSKNDSVDINVPLELGADNQPHSYASLRLDTNTFEDLIDGVIQRVLDIIQHTLAERALTPSDIDEILLVGGATQIPILRTRITTFFNKTPKTSLPPEQAVALGCALLGDSLKRSPKAPKDVLITTLGIALSDGQLLRVIERDSSLPITRRVIIPTVRDQQTTIEIDVFEEIDNETIRATYLGTVVYPGIKQAPAGKARLVVDLHLDINRMLRISSPEEGREGEFFTLEVAGHAERKNSVNPEPSFRVAQEMPVANVTLRSGTMQMTTPSIKD